MKRIVYFRVSTEAQSHERQLYRMQEYYTRMGMSWDNVEIVSEKITSHTSFTERKLYPYLVNAQKDDVIYVCQLDRLGRTMVDILALVDFAVKKGVTIITIDNGYQIENKTAMGKLYLGMVSAMAEAERELRAERCQAGVDSAIAELKEKGMRKTRNGTIQTQWGNSKGCDTSAATEASIIAKKERSLAWRKQSAAVKFAFRERAKGRTYQQIVDSLSELYDDNKPSDPNVMNPYGTPQGIKPQKAHISNWLNDPDLITI